MYEDILEMDRPVSQKYPPMTYYNRAAQFAPFAALTGLDGQMEEAGRFTQSDIELTEDRVAELDRQLWAAVEGDKQVRIVCFVPDRKKEGGSFQTFTGHIKKADPVDRVLLLDNGQYIPLWTIRLIMDDQ